jgi:hypothetical protein
MRLNWVYDEYFVTPEIWRSVFQPQGISSRPVTNARGVELGTVVQLVADEQVSLDSRNLESRTCQTCGRLLYQQVERGPIAALRAEPVGEIARTEQWFDLGAASHNLIVVSGHIARALQRLNVRGARLTPLASDEG